MIHQAPSDVPATSVKKIARLCVLGVDPAVAGATGYGVVEFIGSSPRLLRFGALKLPARATFAAAQASIPAHSYSPREVKSSVAGYGAASKQQMQQMVSSALGLTEYPEPADAADALAVALCHAHSFRARERLLASITAIPTRVRPGSPLGAPKTSLRNQTRAARISGL
jgi:Holliday junction resolvasome RuvABC endonuclease subunit